MLVILSEYRSVLYLLHITLTLSRFLVSLHGFKLAIKESSPLEDVFFSSLKLLILTLAQLPNFVNYHAKQAHVFNKLCHNRRTYKTFIAF